MDISIEEVKNGINNTIQFLKVLETPVTRQVMSKETIDTKRKEATTQLKSLLAIRDMLQGSTSLTSS